MWLASSNTKMGGWQECKGGGGIGIGLFTKAKVMNLTLATMEAKAVATRESIGEAYQKYSSAIGIVGLMQFLMENNLHSHPWGSSHRIQQNF